MGLCRSKILFSVKMTKCLPRITLAVLLWALQYPVTPGFAAPPLELPVFPANALIEGLDEQIFPLGWAKDGERLAVLLAKPNEASDERTWKVQVIDLVSETLVLDEEILHVDQGGIEGFWLANENRVMELIKPHQVVPDEFHLHPFPALLGRLRSDSYEVSLTREYGKEPNIGYQGIRNLDVSLLNSEKETKSIFKKSWNEWLPLASGVVGYLPNPQGSRIAVIIAITWRGYESAPHVRSFFIVGAGVAENF